MPFGRMSTNPFGLQYYKKLKTLAEQVHMFVGEGVIYFIVSPYGKNVIFIFCKLYCDYKPGYKLEISNLESRSLI